MTDLALFYKLRLLFQNLSLLVQSGEQVHDGNFFGGGVDVHDADVSWANNALVLENIDFGIKETATLNNVLLRAHHEPVAKIFLFNAFHFHSHVVAGLSDIHLEKKNEHAKIR